MNGGVDFYFIDGWVGVILTSGGFSRKLKGSGKMRDNSGMDNLLAYLAHTPVDGRFQQWQLKRIPGSANNILYRTAGPERAAVVLDNLAH